MTALRSAAAPQPAATAVRRSIAAGVGVFALTLAVSGCSLPGGETVTRDADTREVTESGDADVFALQVGDCFNDTTSESIAHVPAVPCSESHDNEVFHIFDMEDGEYPGDEAIMMAAFEQCVPPFEEFVGMSYEESVLDVFPITPSGETWAADDREVVCAIWDTTGRVSGTLAGAAR
ncbi:septum formation family protein [Ruicaihuangia caeni]|uniref:Septum formation family protein n=1 Tax=Ruicaihuangia caeni TaxID=3042517 RepID=A0AAW6TAJ4_9MICO|nr:septum formation family protein [Klugiella sp. YN-L-19]MDI2099439.1 septum formation family protein [Klugiella sp. YN-L-19]